MSATSLFHTIRCDTVLFISISVHRLPTPHSTASLCTAQDTFSRTSCFTTTTRGSHDTSNVYSAHRRLSIDAGILVAQAWFSLNHCCEHISHVETIHDIFSLTPANQEASSRGSCQARAFFANSNSASAFQYCGLHRQFCGDLSKL